MLSASVAATPSAAAPSPGTLYRALLARPFPVAQLPSGLRSSAIVAAFSPSELRDYADAVGGVRVKLSQGRSVVDYLVFPTHATAVAVWRARVTAYEDQEWRATAGTPTLPTPSRLYLALQGSHSRITLAIFVSGRVLIAASTTVGDAAVNFNEADTVTLARVAQAHLLQVAR
jgi:hypothetical protein